MLRLFLGGLGTITLIWALTYHSVIYNSVFAPMFEQVRRNTYENSESYVRGTIQDLRKLQLSYLREKDPTVREALKATILQTVDGFNFNSLPSDLNSFIESIKQ
jgi:hypothetical protein